MPTTPSTLFQMASITKMFTATAAVSLADDGTLDLAAPVKNLATQLGYGQITLHQLLSHSSGLPTAFPNEGVFGLHNWLTNNQNAKAELWAPPGAVSKLQAHLTQQGKTTELVSDSYYGYDNYTFGWSDPNEGEMDAPVTFWVEGNAPAKYMVSVYGVGTRK